MTPTTSEASTSTLKKDTTMEEEISYTPTSPTLHTRPRYPGFVASSPGLVYSPTSPTHISPTSPRYAATSPIFSPTSYNASSPSFADSRPSYTGFSPVFGPTPGFIATSPKKNTPLPDTVLSAIRCVPVETSSKDGF